MGPIKVTFDRELMFEGKTFEKESTYDYPQEKQYFLDNHGEIKQAEFDFGRTKYPILTEKKKTYVVLHIPTDMPIFGESFNDVYFSPRVAVTRTEE